jgi:hypothetical protein
VGKKITKSLLLKKCKNATQNFKTWIQTHVRKTKKPKTKSSKVGAAMGVCSVAVVILFVKLRTLT